MLNIMYPDAGSNGEKKCSENCRGIVAEVRGNSGKLRERAKMLKSLPAEGFAAFSTTYEIAFEIIMSQLL